jgi:hypothetical protein
MCGADRGSEEQREHFAPRSSDGRKLVPVVMPVRSLKIDKSADGQLRMGIKRNCLNNREKVHRRALLVSVAEAFYSQPSVRRSNRLWRGAFS